MNDVDDKPRVKLRGRPAKKHPLGTPAAKGDGVQFVAVMPVQMRALILAESQRLGISMSEFVRMCVLAWTGNQP